MKRIIVFLVPILVGTLLFAQNTETLMLSGTGNDNMVEWDFFCTGGQNSGKWSKIGVPSCWELQGFGHYNYGHDHKKAKKDSTFILGNEKGLYKYNFSVPATWEGKEIFIFFDGSMTDTEVKINGKLAGDIHQGAFYQFSYNISNLINYQGDNLLEVTVSKRSSNESINSAEREADYWIFGGIFRPVYLKCFPVEHVKRIAINAKADGYFEMNVYTENIKKAKNIETIIKPLNGNGETHSFTSNIDKKNNFTRVTSKIEAPDLWSPEFPNLYTVTVHLLDGKGNIIHSSDDERFGFRTIDFKAKDGIYVNNQKIILKGVNRHCFYPSSGRTTSKSLSIQDVLLIKEMNMNAVRMSHYSPDKHFLDACDSLGLFVLDELAGWQRPGYDTEIGKKLVAELIAKDVNHPSIILWDNANEGGWNYELDAEFAKHDIQKRHVVHPWEIFDGFDTQHYKSYGYGSRSLFNGSDIFCPTEFLHGLYDGGHGAGLDDYWNLMVQNPLSAGGFLWCMIDESVVRTDKDGILDSDGNHAPDGILGPYREKEGSFYTIKEIWSPVYIDKKIITPQWNQKLLVENRYLYTNLNQCKFSWKLAKMPKPFENNQEIKVTDEGSIEVDDIAPSLKGYLEFNMPEKWHYNDVLYLTATDPFGREIFTWSWPLTTAADFANSVITEQYSTTAEGTESEKYITVNTPNMRVTFDKSNGNLFKIIKDDYIVPFLNGPDISHDSISVAEVKHYADGNNYIIEVQYSKGMEDMRWTVMGNGWLKLEYNYRVKGTFPYCGVDFNYNEKKVRSITWVGDGPYRVWKNRLKGTQFNIWNKEYNDAITGVDHIYPEFKGYYSNMYWATIQTDDLPVTVLSATDDMYLRLFTPKWPSESRNANADFPGRQISFMHTIPPIGTKFHKAEDLGPQSKLNECFAWSSTSGPFNGCLYFYFGN